MSKERARNRAAREREAAAQAAAGGTQTERDQPRGSAPATAGTGTARKPAAKTAKAAGTGATSVRAAGKKPPKRAAPRTPATKRRGHAPVGRSDGPLARRRRFRTRLLLGVLLAVNVVVAIIWRDWTVSLAALILSVILAPLAAAILLRRK